MLPKALDVIDEFCEHFADNSVVDLNNCTANNEDYLDKCNDLFHSEYGAPIPFKQQMKGDKGSVELDKAI